jgi:hypothetical protein
MKNLKILCLFLFVTIASVCLSQDYIPIVETGNYFSLGMSLGGTDLVGHTYYEIIGEDTVIGEQIYKKLYKSKSGVEYHSLITKQLIGLVRETDDRKVYARNLNGHEGLIYDYYVEKGDTLNFLNPFLSGWLYEEYQAFTDELSDTLAIVDSVYFAEINGESRKHYILNAYGSVWPVPMLYIEGVGGLRGFFFCGSDCFHLTGGTDYLLCAYKNGDLYYDNPNYDFCYLLTNTEDFDISEIQIFPNPATSILNIFSEENIESVEILNISGQVVSFKTVSNNIAEVDISALSSGVCFAKIYFLDNVLVRKFVVE